MSRTRAARPARQKRRVRKRALTRFMVVTGLSGSGKTHAIHALEDLGYFCVDNLPTQLIPTFAELCTQSEARLERVAIVVDVRERGFLSQFPPIYRKLRSLPDVDPKLIFLEANRSALVRRFSETRRPHPLALNRPVAEGLSDERRLLQPIRRLADQVLDTSALTVHELRRRIRETTGGAQHIAPLVVTLLSFGFRRGVPEDADLVFDVRFLPNPHFVTSLRRWSGRNARVSRYVLRSRTAAEFMKLTTELLRFLIPQYINEGKTYLTIAIGCTGGRHRSVAIAETLHKRLKATRGIQIRVRHRDVAEA